jgi:hypothetical protein
VDVISNSEKVAVRSAANAGLEMKSIVELLSSCNRYQGSLRTVALCYDLRNAILAALPRGRCEVIEKTIGLGVEFHGFAAPAPWDLLSAKIAIAVGSEEILERDEVDFPLLVASNSRPFSGELRVVDILSPFTAGAIVLLPADADWSGPPASVAKALNARGFMTDKASRLREGVELRGRLELAIDSDLFGISLTRSEIDLLRAAALSGDVRARIEIEASESGALPVLEYSSGPEGAPAILLVAHICHPRPGANDNASGVAVAIEVCRLLAEWEREGRIVPPVRFIAGPEFTGTAAYLSCRDVATVPLVINIDTVGGDSALTGARLVLETAPDFVHGELHDILVARAADAADKGEIDMTISGFHGYSDHAIFAANAFNIPSVQFGQLDDAFNHTDHDVEANLSYKQMGKLAHFIADFLASVGVLENAVLLGKNTPKPCSGVGKTNMLDGPFNFRLIASKARPSDREWLMSEFMIRKTIYGALQTIWLMQQRYFSQQMIENYLFKYFTDLGSETLLRLVQICSEMRKQNVAQ